jgi:hypothetical protein
MFAPFFKRRGPRCFLTGDVRKLPSISDLETRQTFLQASCHKSDGLICGNINVCFLARSHDSGDGSELWD